MSFFLDGVGGGGSRFTVAIATTVQHSVEGDLLNKKTKTTDESAAQSSAGLDQKHIFWFVVQFI